MDNAVSCACPATHPQRALVLGLLACALFAGCAGLRTPGMARSSRGQSANEQGQEQVRVAAAALLEGIHLYDNGDYDKAITQLSVPGIQAAPNAIRVEALKYTAFSYCVTENYVECRHAFDLALHIDADFKLARSEGGHPMWGPVFEQAKAASEKDRLRVSRNTESEQWRSTDAWRAR